MSATVYALTAEVREAALDVKAVRRRMRGAGDRAYEWYPAEASARARMVALSRRDPTSGPSVPDAGSEQSAPSPSSVQASRE